MHISQSIANTTTHTYSWQYIWLKIHLRDKDPTLFSGTEMHVAPYLAKHSPKCMPIKKSRAIQGRVKDKATLPTLLRKVYKHTHLYVYIIYMCNSLTPSLFFYTNSKYYVPPLSLSVCFKLIKLDGSHESNYGCAWRRARRPEEKNGQAK
jgi:hypothetical protein